jgi:hypothetical protein
MKKILVLLCFTSFVLAQGQEKEKNAFNKNEVKGNALFLVIGASEFTYERLLNEDSAVGASLFFAPKVDSDINFSFSPYYRVYFGKKTAAGFFCEGFGMLNTGEVGNYSNYDSVNNVYYDVKGTKFTDFALGFGLGSKWVHRSGFVFEINAGIGRNLFNDNSPEVVGRGGITLGYRF